MSSAAMAAEMGALAEEEREVECELQRTLSQIDELERQQRGPPCAQDLEPEPEPYQVRGASRRKHRKMSRRAPPPLRVCVRARPLLRRDGASAQQMDVDEAAATVRVGESTYHFDRVLGADASQHAVAHECTTHLVEKLFDGVHGCMFAYGQTGAGKTFSMLGAEGGQRRACQDGVLPLITTDILRRVAQLEAEAAMQSGCSSQYQLRVSFVEVNRERVVDLCADLAGRAGSAPGVGGAGRRQLRLRELDDGSVHAEGVTEVVVHTTAQMLAFVARGSAARATASTGMHDHSSRSHAILTLTLEHRWRDPHRLEDTRVIQKQQAKLALVDLAGSEDMARSHGGVGDKDGIATNLGLHALTRVLSALATGAPHVPYRDATLTRLLQPALGGDCVTQMLACISPAATDQAETDRTLRWAATARGIASKATVHVTQELDTDPMLGDLEDTSGLHRRALWLGPLPGCAALPLSGPLFARVAGDPSKPLLLYVHGSGPRNSSMFWNEVVQAVDSLAPDAYYHVAIDCPGYGRSSGDRQIIRSYPGQFLEGVIQACGKWSAAALIGSSQGACAVMNALLERPLLAEAVAVIHPVGHAVQRYHAISQPALLIFDTEDAGHPVEVGRRMRDALPHATYYEFTNSVHGAWEQQHIGPELVRLLQAEQGRPTDRQDSGRKELPELSVLAGGIRAWSERHGDEKGWDWSTAENCAVEEDSEDNFVLFPPESGVESSSLAPPVVSDVLFSDEEEEDEEQVAAAAEAAARAQAEVELQQTECELCSRHLTKGAVRLLRCRHALCVGCCDWSLAHFEECPICLTKVERKRRPKASTKLRLHLPTPMSDEASLRVQVSLPTASSPVPPEHVLVVAYGNTTHSETDGRHSVGSGKTNYSTFVQIVHGDRNALSRVSFNINPSYTKPTATLASPNGSHARWSFDYAMARPYPCEIKLQFKPDTGLPPLTLEYFMQEQRKFTRRLAVELPDRSCAQRGTAARDRPSSRAKKLSRGILLEKEHCTSSGWFLTDATDKCSGWCWRPAIIGAGSL